MNNHDHIIFSAVSSRSHCRHCGGHYKFNLPLPVREVSRRIDAFMLLHEDCKKKNEVEL